MQGSFDARRDPASDAIGFVTGTVAVARHLEVPAPSLKAGMDRRIAREALEAIRWNAIVPPDRITVAVANGWLTLTGVVEWQFQKEAATRALRPLADVKGITNNISVAPDGSPIAK
jgi:osmotically-inducible protein OsmY